MDFIESFGLRLASMLSACLSVRYSLCSSVSEQLSPWGQGSETRL